MPFYPNEPNHLYITILIPDFPLHFSACSGLSIVPDFDLLGVLSNVAVDGLVDVATFATCYPEDQVIKGCATEDIDMVTYVLVSFVLHSSTNGTCKTYQY